jgi:hypothetical protein
MLFGKIGITSIIGEDACEMLFGKLGITFAKQYPQARLDLDRS